VSGARGDDGPWPGSPFADDTSVVIVVPVILSVVWIALARSRTSGREAPLAPMTRVGWIALLSLALVIVVAVTGASLFATLPVGAVMFGLAVFARWVRHDAGLLLVVPLLCGVSVFVLPLIFE
jgi:hypothetical protein